MTHDLSDELLARYLSGEATHQEAGVVEEWAAAAPEHRAELEELRAALVAVAVDSHGWDVDAAWERHRTRASRSDQITPLPARFPWNQALAWAASVVILAGAVLVWRVMNQTSEPAVEVITTGLAERRTIQLSDGSEVLLSPNSTLRIAAEYGNQERRVDLEGEGWFEVEHDPDRPFRVYAGGSVTEDLGTTFSVRAIAGSGEVRVVLVSGSASLQREGAETESVVVLEPKDVARLLNGASVPQVEHEVVVADFIAWREGKLIFNDAQLREVLPELTRWLGKEFVTSSPDILNRRLTATLQIDDQADIIEVLRLSLGLSVTESNNQIVLSRP